MLYEVVGQRRKLKAIQKNCSSKNKCHFNPLNILSEFYVKPAARDQNLWTHFKNTLYSTKQYLNAFASAQLFRAETNQNVITAQNNKQYDYAII
jgi:hypothetical protein